MKDSEHSIVYIMRHIDIGGHIDIPYKKIGITGKGNADLSSRLRQISNTKSPIQAQCIAAWESANAKKLETALHTILINECVEGEWFYDKDDNLIERIEPIMELINAKRIEINNDSDLYTKTVMEKEENTRKNLSITVLGEITQKLRNPLESSVRIVGPTFFSDNTGLTYYVNVRKSGLHNLDFGRSKDKYEKLDAFLNSLGFDAEKHDRGYAMLNGLNVDIIAEIINNIEEKFNLTTAST